MFAVLTDAYPTLALCWAVAFVAGAGVMVLPWSRLQLASVHEAWQVLGAILVRGGQRLLGRPPRPARVERPELPELSWDLSGDWTTSLG